MAVVITPKKHWTLRELHGLPDDGNKYELVRGELFVTPPPSERHGSIASALSACLTPYLTSQRLGRVYHPRSVMRHAGSELEPDLMVRAPHPDRRDDDSDWTRAPIPILVVEILSDYTRRRDRNEQRELYLDARVAEYWIVDPDERCFSVMRSDGSLAMEGETMNWHPAGAAVPLTFAVRLMFDV